MLIKKISGLLETKQELRFQFLKEHKNELNIRRACQTLNVSKAVFYELLKRKPSKRKKRMNSSKKKSLLFFRNIMEGMERFK